MITVKVIRRSSGKAAEGQKVALGINNAVTRGEWTDSKGQARFDVKPDYGKVFVGGSTVHEGYLSGLIVVNIN